MTSRFFAAAAIALLLTHLSLAEDVAALKQKQEVMEKRVVVLQDQLLEARKQLLAEPELSAAQQQVDNAGKAYDQKLLNSQRIVAAKQAADAADAAERNAINAEMAGDKDAQGLESQYKANDATILQLDAQRKSIQAALAEVKKRISAQPQMQQAADLPKKADEAVLALPRTDPKLAAANHAMEEARKALEARIQTLPERRALDAATRDYERLLETSPELAAARKNRDEAKRAYEAKLSAQTAADPQGAAHLADLTQIQAKIQSARVTAQGIETQLTAQRRKIAQASPKATQARAAADAAHAAYRQAVEEQTTQERNAVAQAQQSFRDKIEARLAADPKLAQTRREIEDLNRQLRDLRDQLKKAAK